MVSTMTRALVLNASFEPLSVVSPRRALVLVMAEKAEVVLESGERIRSNGSTCVPSGFDCLTTVRVPFFAPAAQPPSGVARDGYRCQYSVVTPTSIDHVQPRSGVVPLVGERLRPVSERVQHAQRGDRLSRRPR